MIHNIHYANNVITIVDIMKRRSPRSRARLFAARARLPLFLLLFFLFPLTLESPSIEAHTPAGDPGGEPSERGDSARLESYEMYANVTAYHNKPGDTLNGGSRNYMGLPLRTGYSAAGPADLAGLLVEVPDFNPERDESAVSEELRNFIRRKGYSGYFVIDDIGTWITFLKDGKRADLREGSSLDELSRYSLSSGEPVVDIDIMIPEEPLARSYVNRRCLVRLYVADVGEVRWVTSRSRRWKGKKPIFDTLERHRRYMTLLRDQT
jgi:hypothetical protein